MTELRDPTEGVIKFHAQHLHKSLPRGQYEQCAHELIGWRTLLVNMGVVGQHPSRYDGAAYGNLSCRVSSPSAQPNPPHFLITGTQTGGRDRLTFGDFCLIEGYDIPGNFVQSVGEIYPSSESMTHAAIYATNATIHYVFHGHAPILWRNAAILGLPITDTAVAYGTPEMAWEIRRLYRDQPPSGVFAMGGHEDGVIAFGQTAAGAGSAIMSRLAEAYALSSGPSSHGAPLLF